MRDENSSEGVPSPQSVTESRLSCAERFKALFDGHASVHGVYNGITGHREDGKLVGTDRRTVRGALTLDLFEKHLKGEDGLGVCPIRADSTVRFGAIDIDVYAELEHAGMAKLLKVNSLPLIVCRSKSGGAHVYCFTSESVPAPMMIARLKQVAAILGHGGAEIFPKQAALAANSEDAGSWINLCYFDGVMASRFAVTIDGAALELEEFLDTAEQLRQPLQWFNKPIQKPCVDMPQGPPCLQHLIQIGFPQGTRNSGLYNLGVYFKKLDLDNWENLLAEANHKYMRPPLAAAEVKIVVSSLRKKEYKYSCQQQPVVSYCNSALCRTRKHGICTNGDEPLPEFGGLTKIKTDPETWFWEINGVRIKLATDQLQDPYKFQKVCIARLNLMPRVPKTDEWRVLVQKALSPENLTEVEPSEDLTALGRFKQLVEDFCVGRAKANGRDEILLGKPWDDDSGFTHFRSSDLIAHLKRKGEKVELAPLHEQLREIGAVPPAPGGTKLKGKPVRIWKIPSFAKQTEPHAVPVSITGEEPLPF